MHHTLLRTIVDHLKSDYPYENENRVHVSLRKEMIRTVAACAVFFLIMMCALFVRHGRFTIYEPVTGPAITANDIRIVITEPSALCISSVRISKGMVAVELQRTGRGESGVSICTGDTTFKHTVSSWIFGTLRDSNGNFTCWPVLVCGGAAICISFACIFGLGYREKREINLFSYTTVTLLALTIFFSIVGALGATLSIMRLADPLSYSFSKALELLERTPMYFAVASSPFLLVFSIALFASNIQLIHREGFRSVNILGIILSFLMIAGLAAGFLIALFMSQDADYFLTFLFLNAYYGIYVYFSCLVLAFFAVFNHTVRRTPDFDKDIIVILGCAIQSDGTLYPLVRGRADKALEFARLQEMNGGPTPVFIPSGGQGYDEIISEAEAIANYLMQNGVPSERIFPETRSVNTLQNMHFSREIAEQVKPGGKALFCTTNYHVFRSGLLAGKIGWNPDGAGSRTKWYFWPNALIREFIGLLVDDRKGVISFMLVIILTAATLTYLIR